MSVARVNVLGIEQDEPLDEAGFRHVAASVGDRLGARLRNGPGRDDIVLASPADRNEQPERAS